MASQPSIPALKKGLLILELFGPRRKKMTFSEICQAAGLPKATAFRLLKTLTSLNYLKYDLEDKRYHLGPRVLSLGFATLQSMDMREIARPYLERLANDCRKTVNLGVLDGQEMVYIDRIIFPDLIDLRITIGSRISIYNSALGRAVLAYQEKTRLEELVDKLKDNPHAAPFLGHNGEKLYKTLEMVKQDGYATSDDEFAIGIRAIAVPLFSSNEVSYGLNVVGSSDIISMHDLIANYARKLMETGWEISTMLGYQPAE